MADKKDRVLTYRRATWAHDKPGPTHLEALLKQATNKRKTVPERTFNRYGDQEVALFSYKPASGDIGCFLHIVADTPGEHASVTPTNRQATTDIDVETASAPAGREYMDGDAFVYVVEDHVCFCTTGIQDGSVQWFLQTFIKAANLGQFADRFDLAKMADMKRVTFLQKEGVREIELKATASKAAANYAHRKAHTMAIPGGFSKVMKAVLGNEHDVTEDALNVEIVIKKDGRRRGLKLGQKTMKALALDLLKDQQDDDDFVIVTNSFQRISPKEIFVRSKAQIAAKGKSLDRSAAWAELVKFHKYLKQTGVLE